VPTPFAFGEIAHPPRANKTLAEEALFVRHNREYLAPMNTLTPWQAPSRAAALINRQDYPYNQEKLAKLYA
jgi:hypothetical protein